MPAIRVGGLSVVSLPGSSRLWGFLSRLSRFPSSLRKQPSRPPGPRTAVFAGYFPSAHKLLRRLGLSKQNDVFEPGKPFSQYEMEGGKWYFTNMQSQMASLIPWFDGLHQRAFYSRSCSKTLLNLQNIRERYRWNQQRHQIISLDWERLA